MSKYDVILDVYENQSISKAAQKHNYTQSAVSQTIRNYEKEIGLKLFKRSKNGMEALPGTEPIFEELMHIRSANTRINQIVSNINNLDSGFIRIGTVQSIAYNWLPGVLKNFSAEYPNITFRLYVDGFQNLTEKLHKKEHTAIVMVTHDIAGALPYADKVLHIGPQGYFFGTRREYCAREEGKRMLGTAFREEEEK